MLDENSCSPSCNHACGHAQTRSTTLEQLTAGLEVETHTDTRTVVRYPEPPADRSRERFPEQASDKSDEVGHHPHELRKPDVARPDEPEHDDEGRPECEERDE